MMNRTEGGPSGGASARTLEGLVDALISRALEDGRVRALWIEAEKPARLRRPFGDITIHAVAAEPDFPGLVESWEGVLASITELKETRWSDTVRRARQLDATLELGGSPRTLTFILECAAYLAKRPRKAAVALVDKTGHLLHVMDFSRP